MILSPKLVIGGLVGIALIFGAVKGCDAYNAKARAIADREKQRADSATAVAKARDKRDSTLIAALDRSRIENALLVDRALERAGRDRATRTIEYRLITDSTALALLHRKDTIIDTLSVALVKERALHDTTRFLLDTMIVSRGRWIAIAETRKREADALRKITPSWWKERIKPRLTIGYNVTLARDGKVHHGPGAQAGFQIFP